MSDDVKYPPYTPADSLGHELGILFGFLAVCLVIVGVYYIVWQAAQRHAHAIDEARRRDLHARGFHHERGGYHEKVLTRFPPPEDVFLSPPTSPPQPQSQSQSQFHQPPSLFLPHGRQIALAELPTPTTSSLATLHRDPVGSSISSSNPVVNIY